MLHGIEFLYHPLPPSLLKEKQIPYRFLFCLLNKNTHTPKDDAYSGNFELNGGEGVNLVFTPVLFLSHSST